jgi:hypothetical protein
VATEQEEFEFRARLEKEAAAAPAKPLEEENPTSLKNLAGAAIEPALAMGSGAVATPLAGIAGLLSGLNPDVVRKVQETLSYQPRTTGGQNAMKAFGALPSMINEAGENAGNDTLKVTGSPLAATAMQTLIEGVPQILGARGAAEGASGLGVMKPKAVAPEVRALANEGVTMTPAQRGSGLASTAEEKLTSAPIAGEIIKRARGRAVEQWNTARLNEALKDAGGKSVPQDLKGRDALRHTKQELESRYSAVLGKMKGQLDQPFVQDLDNIKKSVAGLDPKVAKTVSRIVDDEVIKRFKNGVASGDELKGIQETLRTEADTFRRGGYDERKAAAAVDKAKDSLTAMLKRVDPAHAAELEAVDRGYAKYKTSARASNYAKQSGGIYTPGQRLQAIRARDKSKDKDRFSTGTAPGQKQAQAAQDVLGNTVPDSGTPGRAALLYALTHPGTALPGLAASIPASILYSEPVLKALQRSAMKGGSPAGTAGAAALPIGASNQPDQLGVVR